MCVAILDKTDKMRKLYMKSALIYRVNFECTLRCTLDLSIGTSSITKHRMYDRNYEGYVNAVQIPREK